MLRRVLPDAGLVLEIASGSGEHALRFAKAFPELTFQPTDPDLAAIASIKGWRNSERLPNLLPPLRLDASDKSWPIDRVDAILCINMVHISPWAATEGLMQGAAATLPAGGLLYVYGPYLRAGVPTAPSNAAFDLSLRTRHADWGLRDVEQVTDEAQVNGFILAEIVDMPANNLSLVFRKG